MSICRVFFWTSTPLTWMSVTTVMLSVGPSNHSNPSAVQWSGWSAWPLDSHVGSL